MSLSNFVEAVRRAGRLVDFSVSASIVEEDEEDRLDAQVRDRW